MTLYHTMENDIENLPVEVAIPISGRVTIADPEMELRTIPAAKVVSLIHKGPYETLSTAYSRLLEYAERNNIEVTAPFREIYLSNPEETPADEVMTEIQATVK